jgi:hypothetical protein
MVNPVHSKHILTHEITNMKTVQILLRTCLGIGMVVIYVRFLKWRFSFLLAPRVHRNLPQAFQVKTAAPVPLPV